MTDGTSWKVDRGKGGCERVARKRKNKASSSGFYRNEFPFSPKGIIFFCISFSVALPGRFYELNVHFGVFVGGMGDFSEIFLGNQETFRGCMEDVMFNGIDVLEQAKRVSDNNDGVKLFSSRLFEPQQQP